MRGVKSTLALLGILVGLGAYIYFVESRRDPVADGAANRERVFGDLDGAKIEELTIETPVGGRATLAKTDGAWQMTSPVRARVDVAEVAGLTNSLGSLETERVVEEKPADLAEYGLAAPKVDITFRAEGSTDVRHLLLGDKTATGGDLYAKLGDSPRVFLIPAYLETTFAKTAFDLRDKSVLTVERDKVDAVEVEAGARRIRAVKADGLWRLQKPVEAPADFGAVEGIVTRLATGQMRAIVAEDGSAGLAAYGLDKPAAVATVASGSSRATLLIGKAAPEDGQLYAKDASRDIVFTVESALLEDIGKEPADLRRKDLFEFRPFNANRVEISRGGETTAFEKTRDEKTGTDTWRRVQPNPADVDATKMEAFLSALSNLRAQSFAAGGSGASLTDPVLAASVSFDEGKRRERVVFARSGTEVLASGGEPAPPAQLDPKSFDEAVAALDAIAK